MKKIMLPGLLLAILVPGFAIAQSSFDGTWKLNLGALPVPKKPNVWLLQDGTYQCKSCTPLIQVKADGQDQRTPGQPYDTISVRALDDRTVEEIEKKNGQNVSDEKFTVSRDGSMVTDEFASWKVSMARIAKGPAGSHALSGSRHPLKIETVSDKWLLITYKLAGEILTMSRPTGQSYAAKLDGTDAPYNADPGINGVSIKRVDRNTIEETDKFNGKPLTITRMTVTPDGKSMTIVAKNLQNGTKSRFTAQKR